MTSKYKKRCTTLSLIRKMIMKTTMKHYYTYTRMAKIKTADNTKCWWGYRATRTLTHYYKLLRQNLFCLNRKKLFSSIFWLNLFQMGTHITVCFNNSTFSYISSRNVYTEDVYIQGCSEQHVGTPPNGKQSKYESVVEGMNKMGSMFLWQNTIQI